MAVVADDDAADARVGDIGAVHVDARFELTTCRHRRLQQRPVEIAPHDRAPAQAARIPSFDRDAAFAGDQHPADAQSASLDRLDDAKLPQARERSWVDRVSAQLVARKRCAIDDAHAGAGAREHQAGNRAGRTRTHNKDIMHWVIG